MKITEKIVTSVTPPQQINVLWHNPETGELKMFGNKGWEVVGGNPGDDSGDSDSSCSGTCGGYPIVNAKLDRISFEVDDNLNRIEGTDKYGFSEVWTPNTWYNCLNTSDQYESTSVVLTAPPAGGSLYFFTAEYIPSGDPIIDDSMQEFMFPLFLALGMTGASMAYDDTSEKPYVLSFSYYGFTITCKISSIDLNTIINAEMTISGSFEESVPFMFKWISITNKSKLIYIPFAQMWIAAPTWQPNDHEYWTKVGTIENYTVYLNETDGMLYSPNDNSHIALKVLEYIPDDNTSTISTTKEYICNTNVNAMETNLKITWANEPPTFDGTIVVTLSVVDEVGCYTVK